MNTSFVLRLNWDTSAHSWRILLKPTNGDDARLFQDPEAFFAYLTTYLIPLERMADQHDLASFTPTNK